MDRQEFRQTDGANARAATISSFSAFLVRANKKKRHIERTKTSSRSFSLSFFADSRFHRVTFWFFPHGTLSTSVLAAVDCSRTWLSAVRTRSTKRACVCVCVRVSQYRCCHVREMQRVLLENSALLSLLIFLDFWESTNSLYVQEVERPLSRDNLWH